MMVQNITADDVATAADTSEAEVMILALTRKPESASFEQRVANYVEPLGDHGIHVAWHMVPEDRGARRKLLARAGEYDAVWWHRYLPQPWSPRGYRKQFRKLVFDFDDPVVFASRNGGRPSLTRRLRFSAMLRVCDAALPASHYLADLARPFVDDIEITPMAIDVADQRPASPSWEGDIELLWLGSRSTQPYLEQIRPALEALGERHRHLRLRLVGHEPMSFGRLAVDFRTWSPQEQDASLRECHIGLCPMPDTLWTRGKCPFKVLQYMAAGMPWVGSAVGENVVTAGTVDKGARGLCATDTASWIAAVERLNEEHTFAAEMSESGFNYVRAHHSRAALTTQLARFWRRMAEKG